MLGFMAMDYFRNSPVLFSALFALAIFMLVFCMVTLRAVLTNKARYEALASLPLEDDEPVGGSRG
jgi:hypothetical protein